MEPSTHRTAPDGAVVLAGGTGRRLGGVDKSTLRVGGHTLLESALAAASVAADVVVVGATEVAGARVVREDPPGGGPAAGLLAGVRALEGAETVLVLAVDMPGVSAATVSRLVAALDAAGRAADVAVLHDGRPQPLCGVYRVAPLLLVAPADPDGLPVRHLLRDLERVDVAALPGEARDVDTWEDLAGEQ